MDLAVGVTQVTTSRIIQQTGPCFLLALDGLADLLNLVSTVEGQHDKIPLELPPLNLRDDERQTMFGKGYQGPVMTCRLFCPSARCYKVKRFGNVTIRSGGLQSSHAKGLRPASVSSVLSPAIFSHAGVISAARRAIRFTCHIRCLIIAELC